MLLEMHLWRVEHDRLGIVQHPVPTADWTVEVRLTIWSPNVDRNSSTCIRNGYIMTIMGTKTTNKPLTPAVFHILLALSTEERHGYGIMKQVEMDSRGNVNMGPGTLYGSLKRMLEAGLIRESDKKVDPEMDDERRIYYKITGSGQKVLAAELERYQEVIEVARQKQLSPNVSYGR